MRSFASVADRALLESTEMVASGEDVHAALVDRMIDKLLTFALIDDDDSDHVSPVQPSTGLSSLACATAAAADVDWDDVLAVMRSPAVLLLTREVRPAWLGVRVEVVS